VSSRIEIDLNATTSVTRQIVDQLRLKLVDGSVSAGDALPSVRRLAVDLGVHFNTVADAYRTLADEGWLDISQGRGAIVRSRTTPAASAETRQRFRQRLQQLVAEARAQGVTPAALARELTAITEALK
jgi:GntR family transcriptional regulator